MIQFSVVIPTHNNRAVIARTLQSVRDSIEHALAGPGAVAGAMAEVLVVDDGSTDGTPQAVSAWAGADPRFRVIRRGASGGASCPRNVGAAAARGDVLFFLDGDDLYLQHHISLCLEKLRDESVDFVKTGVRLSDPVHPEWRWRVGNSLIINLAVRRACHERLGGFLDYHVFRREDDRFVHELDAFKMIEDVFYNRMLTERFRGLIVPDETVEYLRYPGNSFDRQYARFQLPFDQSRDLVDDALKLQIRLAELLMEYHVHERRNG
jgi:glycosyltransferase involved in cell wall biosynthesis